MKNEDEQYTLQNLEDAVRDLTHHRGILKDTQSVLKGKRDAIKSFEDDEARAAMAVAEHEAKVKKIANKLGK
jgi:hypothetical protein